ncbi:hypothetical protein ACIBIZ_22025 [Nonomuraea spiralis]|uniref:DUF397 domain-containing protein n=1 Tax=Nonomuraea spiralis TaxID=46182 RepID=A0ABV5I5U1_9ACTN|nr:MULTISPECIES: hypothetical protein [Nonomuraea]RSN06597.1 hypothetical protein DMB42_25290 [Nonomuraea sp. WAC 01424]GGS64482.1 hypothetical protein GCM10010176_003540 [Nonomuraea spiralis]
MNDDVRVKACRINDHVELIHDSAPDVVLEIPRRDWQDFLEAVRSGAFELEILPRKAEENAA